MCVSDTTGNCGKTKKGQFDSYRGYQLYIRTWTVLKATLPSNCISLQLSNCSNFLLKNSVIHEYFSSRLWVFSHLFACSSLSTIQKFTLCCCNVAVKQRRKKFKGLPQDVPMSGIVQHHTESLCDKRILALDTKYRKVRL